MADLGAIPGITVTNVGGLGTTDDSFIADIASSAQLGYGPNLPMIDGATPLVFPPVYAVVTHVPSFFEKIYYSDGNSNTVIGPSVLKALVERHAKEISGIDFGYQLEGVGTPVGQDGQEIHMPTVSKRTPVTPTFLWPELQGNLVWNLARYWIESIKHPDTQASSLTSIASLDSAELPMLYSSFTMSVLFIQFDPSFRPERIIDAWYVTNMWPQETGLIGAKKQVGHSETQERSIAFYGVLQHNRNTKVAGQIVAQALGLHRVNYDFAVPFSAVGTGPDTGTLPAGGTNTGIDDALKGLGLEGEATADAGSFSPIISPNFVTGD